MKLVINPKILNRWLQAKIKLHSDKLTSKEEKQIREYEQMNPCRYCTDFLENHEVETEDNYRCAMCRGRDTLD